MMKRFLWILVMVLWSNVGLAKPTVIVCELKKYIVRENAFKDEVQTPLNKVDSTYLSKENLNF